MVISVSMIRSNEKVIDNKIALEICLTSNIQYKTQPSYKEHPAKQLLDAGVKVTLNTDCYILNNSTLIDEYDKAINEAGFTYNDLITCNINSIEASFMPEKDKQTYIDELKKYYKYFFKYKTNPLEKSRGFYYKD